jgi:adenine-specific DNA-methyltransferase
MAIKKLTAKDPETKSPDLVAENLAQLKALFPELITEGQAGASVNVDVLKGLVGDKTVTDVEEKYGLNWHGKRQARQLALTPSTGTLRPCPEESVDWDSTQNLMIEGDNLEVLKLLQKSYAGKVKLIYIDPPYNTGHDFVYPDNFQDNIKNYLELTGQTGEGGNKLSSNTETSGRFHTDWLNMMYPRLKVARNLLRDDGTIFVSIGEDELVNLRRLCDDVFGQESFVGTFVWDGGRKNDSKRISLNHEYVVVYARSANVDDCGVDSTLWRERKNGIDAIYDAYMNGIRIHGHKWGIVSKHLQDWYRSLPESDPAKEHEHYRFADAVGVYFASDLSGPDDGRKNRPRYVVKHPQTGKPVPVPSRGWRWEEPRMQQEIAAGRVHFGADESAIPNGKVYLKENEWQAPSSVFYKDRRAASSALKKLMGEKVFDFPKDTTVISRFVRMLCRPGDIVLDFFAGSGSTAEAVMRTASTESRVIHFILVQLPEPLEVGGRSWNTGLRTIFDIAVERVRRFGKVLSEENPMFAGDLGFRVFKLASSNIQAWDPDFTKLADTLEASVEHLKTDRTENDILFELLLKLGLDLTMSIEEKTIAGKKVQSVGAGTLLVCLAPKIDRKDAEPLALGIVAWHKELAPAGECTVVFKDSAFVDDVAKTNLAAILEQHGLGNVRSL